MQTELKISTSDVQQVAKELNIILSPKQIETILDEHNAYLEQMPTDNWSSIVEVQIYAIDESDLCNVSKSRNEFMSKSRFGKRDGWNADTTFKFFGNTWVVSTSMNGRKQIKSHCYIVQDNGNGMVSHSINFGQKDVKEDFTITHTDTPVMRLTETLIKEYHLKGFEVLLEKAFNNEIECGLDAYKIEIGQVLFTTDDYNQRRAVVEIMDNDTRFKCVYLDGSRTTFDSHIKPYSKKFGIGVYYKENDTITSDELFDLMIQAEENMAIADKERKEAEALAKIEADKQNEYLSQFKVADKRTTSAMIKQHILNTYPSVSKVEVKSDSFSGGDSIDVKYYAPTKIDEINQFVKQLAMGSFDGMTDMYEYRSNREKVIVEGYILQEYKYAGADFVQCDDVRNVVVKLADVVGSNEDVTIVLNEEKNGVEIHFKGAMATKVKDSEEIRSSIKANGFRWSRFGKMWYAKQSPKTIAFANSFKD